MTEYVDTWEERRDRIVERERVMDGTRTLIDDLIATVHAKEAWIDGAKVDLGALDEANDGLGKALVEARAQIAKVRDLCAESRNVSAYNTYKYLVFEDDLRAAIDGVVT